ncbi:putative Ca2+/H+ antiporter (TMEM165/GDT1 family) [Saccharopolyspora lacisalsi]|uniref:GDT1 family protein n=1 Tax=Halosaccharopolyspora lacisalsi TaxID=1000566 RepID=A0A839DWW2_9PSEU|nr:TMEM165/GDT1 family protein [Halosaccharopolyspora lacisalsi]MBA8825523.1 putative Ca2+/H+ antiporter (TMEM165/GDT1 family) [Halosaccharopolyspora lacisalsi]
MGKTFDQAYYAGSKRRVFVSGGDRRATPVLTSIAVSSTAIFVAELGDKSQLMAMTFATRYRAWQVLLGITAATTVVHAGSVALGLGMGNLIPAGWVGLVAGVAFLGFAAWTARGDRLTDTERNRAARSTGSAVLAVTAAFFLAELGDKTMLATITLATQHGWLGTWIGSTVGMVLADALAIGVGLLFGKHLPERLVRYGAAFLFAVFGVWMTVDAVLTLV